MTSYMVTLKIARDPMHDPKNKVTGPCPLDRRKLCTDVTGQHHTVLELNTIMTAEQIRDKWTGKEIHVTRIEEV